LVLGVVGPPGDPQGAVRTTQPLHRLVQGVLVACRDHHPGAVGDQPLRDAQADAATRTRHDRRPALEPARHDRASTIIGIRISSVTERSVSDTTISDIAGRT
jgi:hypothetical protein